MHVKLYWNQLQKYVIGDRSERSAIDLNGPFPEIEREIESIAVDDVVVEVGMTPGDTAQDVDIAADNTK